MLEQTDDMTLKVLIELAVASIDLNEPVFPNLLDTPILWRKFLVSVQAARDDARAAKEALDKAIPDMPKI